MSRPARGAWIEIRNEKFVGKLTSGRAPRGARGLKSAGHGTAAYQARSRPARGAWIEIGRGGIREGFGEVAPRAGRVD